MQPKPVAIIVSAIMKASRTSELLATLDAYYNPFQTGNTPVAFGVKKVPGRSIERERKEANSEALAVLARAGGDPSRLTEADRAALRKYTGEGGIGGSQDEYYTPQYVAEGVWDAMAAMGMGPGNYVEPSCGVGVFNGTKPAGVIITGAELSDTSSQINQLLHPEDTIHTGAFETLAVTTEDGTWDGAVGNVPFASNRAGLADKDPEYRDIKYVDQYFITRTLDKLRGGALLCMVVPPRITSRAAWKKWREQLSLKAEFLGAHRLPSSTFGENGTDTVTDVLVMRKHPDELAALIADRKTADLKAANVIWDTWTSGKWFESSEGKRFIHGEQSVGTFQNRLEVKAGAITGAEIKAKLAHKFESRIDWLALELVEPQIRTWSEGDERLINGRWRRLINGQWQEVSRTAADGNTIDKTVYGVDNLATLKRITSNPAAALSLSYGQLVAAQRDFPSLFEGQIKQAMAMAAEQEPKNQERVLRGTLIGINVQSLAAMLASTGEIPQEEAAILRQIVSAEVARYGAAAADRELSALRYGPVASSWQSFVQSTDANGNLSDLLNGKVERGNTIAFDNTSAEQTIAYLYGVKDLNPVELSDFIQVYKGSASPTLSDLAKIEGVAITPDGMLAPMDRATCGNVVQSVASLRRAMATTSDQNLLDNFQRQLDAIEAKRIRNKIDDIEITMAAKWLPRRYVMEFLKDQGYLHFGYGKVVTNEEGFQELDTEYEGEDGIFWGYETREDLKKKSRSGSSFEVQLEHYLNGGIVSGGSLEGTAGHMSRISALEEDFGTWIRQHDDADKVIDTYNDTFHGYIAPEHSDAPLSLPSVAGEITPFPYQNQAVRRLSEDGRGMLCFGTGLGKTTTAYMLAAYNIEMGRSKRTGIVVPKAVLENWYHEAIAAYGRAYVENCFFPGLDVVIGADGEIEQAPVLDDEGSPKLDKNGQPLMKDKLKLVNKATLVARMNQIPHTSKKIVILTKEQFAELPLREDTVVEHVDEMLLVGLSSGYLEREANNHRAAAKKANFKDKHSNTGTAKKSEYPYYEDCGFDSVIVDEAHNYRNTYEVNRQSASLAHLPKPKSAKMAMDMQVKMSYLQRRNHGRGPVLLTATPTANSPCDIFNMLNHIMRPHEWAQYGIGDINDFIKTFGYTELVEVQKLTGEVEMRQGLVGFKNLSGLRSLFHRHCNLKSAQDVSDEVKVPDLEEHQIDIDMTAEQEEIYEELRARAEAISEPEDDDTPKESIFSIIADMDRVVTDLDLYHKTITYLIPAGEHDKLRKLVADLPETITRKVPASATSDDDDLEDYAGDGKTVAMAFTADAKITHEGDTLRLVVRDVYEPEVTSRLAKFGIDTQTVTHPMTPKYARLVENVRESYENGGKQIIFAEDKRQHEKLRRLLAHHLDIKPAEIGIINADTVAGKSDFVDEKGKKVKDVEPLAAAYNEGRFRILICNKKAEVGVNLHHGTTDIHHLTLPWTPASIKQRNGRGARVGASQSKVRVHYYMGKGSFDEHRLATLKRKAEWQFEILQQGGAERASNANVADAAEVGLLLAKDPDERKRKVEEAQKEAQRRMKDAASKRANIDLHNYLKASHDLAADRDTLESSVTQAKAELEELQSEILSLQSSIKTYQERVERATQEGYSDNWSRVQVKEKTATLNRIQKTLPAARQRLVVAEKRVARLNSAEAMCRRLRGEVDRAINNGTITAPSDVLDHGDQYLTDGVNLIKKGLYYNTTSNMVVEVKTIHFDTKVAVCRMVYKPGISSYELDKEVVLSPASFTGETSYSMTEITLMRKMLNAIPVDGVATMLTESQFTEYLESGHLKLTGADYYLLRTEDGYSSEYVGYGNIKSSLAKQLVYPAPSDGEKAKIAAWCLKNRNQMSEYGGLGKYLKAIFGKNLVATIEAYGKTAPEQTINEWVALQRAAYIVTPAAQEAWAKAGNNGANPYSANWAWDFEKFASKAIPQEWDNKLAFEVAIEKVKRDMVNEWGAEVEAIKARRSAALIAEYTLGQSRAPEEGRSERLANLRSLGNAVPADTLIVKTDLSSESPYSIGGKFDIHKAMADMDAIGISVAGLLRRQSGQHFTQTDLNRSFENAMYELTKTRNNPLDAWEAARKLKEAPEPVPYPTADKVQEAKAAITMANSEEQEINGVTVRPAAGELVLIGKYKRQTRLPGEWIGLHDPAGFSGPLYAAKEQLKAKYGAKYAKNGNDQFPDSWWFVPANTPIEELKTLLGEAA